MKKLDPINLSGNSIPGDQITCYLTCMSGRFFVEDKYEYVPLDDPGEGTCKIIIIPPLVLACTLDEAKSWMHRRILETLIERGEIVVGEYAFGGDYYEWRN